MKRMDRAPQKRFRNDTAPMHHARKKSEKWIKKTLTQCLNSWGKENLQAS